MCIRDRYKREAQSVADATGGDYLLIQSTSATGPAIAENFPNKGVVFFDSHGTQDGTSSYLLSLIHISVAQMAVQNGNIVSESAPESVRCLRCLRYFRDKM